MSKTININVIEGKQIKLVSLYKKILKNELYNYPLDYKKIVFYGIKLTNALQAIDKKNVLLTNISKEIITTSDLVMYFIQKLTPYEIYEMFPTKKDYDGLKYECKDWFYVEKKKKDLDLHSPLKDFAFDFLWEYTYNQQIICFLATYCSTIDRYKRSQGEKSILESFFETLDTPIDKWIKKDNYMMNTRTGEKCKILNNSPFKPIN